MISPRLSIRSRAWIAILLPPLSWFAFQQGLSALLHAACGRWMAGFFWGLASLALCALAARMAWPLRASRGLLVHRWLAAIALAVTAIFALAIAFQILALLLVPPCVG